MTSEKHRSLRAAGFAGEIMTEAPLAPMTTWRIGGPAELLAEPRGVEDLRLALSWAAQHSLPWRVLGNGSNILVRDAGVRGLVLRLRRALNHCEIRDERIVAGAGAMLPALVNKTAAAGLSGIEFGAGIPGTLGGALVMNAGWHEHELGQFVEVVKSLSADGLEQSMRRDECGFAYRQSRFRGQTDIIVSAELHLDRASQHEITARLDNYAAERKANQPTAQPSCGSVFLKPPGDFAGRLIDRAGLKGQRVGALQVSPKHANFFVNLGGGTAAEALELVELVEAKVAEEFGVRLTREFELW